MTSRPPLVLTYFGVRGACDKIRLLMAQGGLPFHEVVVKGQGKNSDFGYDVQTCFPEFATAKKQLEFGQLPLLGL
jgi:hypothetical protein